MKTVATLLLLSVWGCAGCQDDMWRRDDTRTGRSSAYRGTQAPTSETSVERQPGRDENTIHRQYNPNSVYQPNSDSSNSHYSTPSHPR